MNTQYFTNKLNVVKRNGKLQIHFAVGLGYKYNLLSAGILDKADLSKQRHEVFTYMSIKLQPK